MGSFGVHTHMCLCGFLSPAGSASLAEPQVTENVVLRRGINHTGTGGFILPQNKLTGTKSRCGFITRNLLTQSWELAKQVLSSWGRKRRSELLGSL